MSDVKKITLDAIASAAVQEDKILRALPFMVLRPKLEELGVILLEAKVKNRKTVFRRKGSISGPYKIGGTNELLDKAILKAVNRDLDPEPCYAALIDNIMNYRNLQVIGIPGTVDNKTKKHGLEFMILKAVIDTVGEDIIDALFHAERDEDGDSPLEMFDGFNTIIDKEIVAGDISVSKGNLVETGAITAPVDGDDTDAYDAVEAFVHAANPFLKKNGILYITPDALFSATKALGNKIKYKTAWAFAEFQEHLAQSANAPKLKIISDPALGSGSRLKLTVPGNLDFGISAQDDTTFIDVAKAFNDPNIVRYWLQYQAATRITDTHAKVFCVNEQVNTAVALSGDYQSDDTPPAE